MLAPLSEDSVAKRQIEGTVAKALDAAARSLPARDSLLAGGTPEIVQQGGEYDGAGNWENYLSCGDALDSAGCAP